MECRKPQKRKNLRLLILTTNLSKPGHDVAWLFFCLASAEGAGLLFCPAAMHPYTSVYSAFCSVRAVYTANTAKRLTGLYSGFLCDLSHSTAANIRPTQAAIIPTAPRRTLHSSAQTAYYNNVYKGATDLKPCKPGGVSMLLHLVACNLAPVSS